MITGKMIRSGIKNPGKIIRFTKSKLDRIKESTMSEITSIDKSKKLYLKGGIRHGFYGLEDNELRDKLRSFCKSLEPQSVFEFGCNVGMNLKEISPGNHYGIDINEEAIAKGKELELNVEVGDEKSLNNIPSNSFDLVLTSSVLDHIPDSSFEEIFANLKRITKKWLVCCEPNEDSQVDLFIHNYKDMMITWDYLSARPMGNGALYHNYIWEKT